MGIMHSFTIKKMGRQIISVVIASGKRMFANVRHSDALLVR